MEIKTEYPNYDGNQSDYDTSVSYDSYNKDPEQDDELRRRRRRYWILIILLFVIGLLGLLGIGYLCSQNKAMKSQYEAYIQHSRDSMMLVVADLNGQIDSLRATEARLNGRIQMKDRSLYLLNRRIKSLLAEYDPEKYKLALAKIKELEDLVASLNAQIEQLTAENQRLANENKVLSEQVSQWKVKYEDLNQTYLACCKTPDGAVAKTATEDASDYTVTTENLDVDFKAFDKNGNEVTVKKAKITDIKTFVITFDAKSTKAGEHLFFVRISDSVKNLLVVPADYSETGKKTFKSSDGDDIAYSFAIQHNFEKADEFEKVTASFDPFAKQIRYLPYKVEIYDSKMKYAEIYKRPPTKKGGGTKKAQWIW